MGKPWERWEEEVLKAAVDDLNHRIPYEKVGKKLRRSTDSIRNHAFQMGLSKPSGVPWYDGLRIGFLDIETVNFEADAGNMLSWALKERGKPEQYDIVTRNEQISCKFDERIVASLSKALQDIDIVVTYYGTGFDDPYYKTRVLMLKQQLDTAGCLYHWDVYYPVRNKLKLHRNSLDAACAAFGIKGKTHLDLQVWNKARVGNKEALEYVLLHNRQDVRILERLFKIIEPLQKWQRKPF
jgi:uncharacterized protein YprB with RNaseH-like and TPR domain